MRIGLLSFEKSFFRFLMLTVSAPEIQDDFFVLTRAIILIYVSARVTDLCFIIIMFIIAFVANQRIQLSAFSLFGFILITLELRFWLLSPSSPHTVQPSRFVSFFFRWAYFFSCPLFCENHNPAHKLLCYF